MVFSMSHLLRRKKCQDSQAELNSKPISNGRIQKDRHLSASCIALKLRQGCLNTTDARRGRASTLRVVNLSEKRDDGMGRGISHRLLEKGTAHVGAAAASIS